MSRLVDSLRIIWRQGYVGKVVLLILAGLLLTCPCTLLIAVLPSPRPTPSSVALGRATATSPAPVPTSTAPPTHTTVPASTRTNIPTPSAIPSREERIRAAVEKALGTSNRRVQRVQQVAVDGSIVTVHWAIDDNFTEGLIKLGANFDIKDVLQDLFTRDLGITRVIMLGSFSMVDVYGNVIEDVVIRYEMSAATAAKVNWEEVDPHNLYRIADAAQIHPFFRW